MEKGLLSPSESEVIMFFDWTYLIILFPFVILAMWAQMSVKTTYAKYSRVLSRKGVTAEMAVRRILDSHGLHHISITRVHGDLTDHYDPKNGTIALSDSVYGNTSVAAIGVAAHEAGHAIQHAEAYSPLTVRNAIVPVANFGSMMCMPLVLIGIITSFYPLAYAGIVLFSLTTVFQLLTLPTELNASRRAMKILESDGYLNEDELGGTKKVLTAAAMTYIAALFVSLASLLRLILIVNGGRGRRD
jgi:Zn-dependent membrane protease YugP